jgi:hypothetical protein
MILQTDTLASLSVSFTDLSSYEPASWYWTFGDGTISQDTSPIHAFSAAGTYPVCLIVSNSNSSDTVCYNVTVVAPVVETEEPSISSTTLQIVAYPNPVSLLLTFEINGLLPNEQVTATFNDMLGRAILNTSWNGHFGQVDVSSMQEGIYSVRLNTKSKASTVLKILKID